MSQKLIPHIDHAISPQAHTPMYLMHKYWARKPHNVVGEYIEHYSKKGEIVLDPFVGSGVTAIEALKRGRKAIAIDLNPIAIFITRMTAIPTDIELIKKEYEKIKNAISKEIRSYYLTKCPKCKTDNQIICSIWEEGEDTPSEIRFHCNVCRKNISKKPDTDDIKKVQKIKKQNILFWHPNPPLRYSNNMGFMKKEKAESLDDLFTKRNLICLSLLFNEISKIPDREIRELFLFRFTSMVHLASRMTPDRPTRPHSSFWAIQSFWIPPKHMESNIWNLFENAITEKQGLIVGKQDTNQQISIFKEAKDFDDLKSDSNILLLNQSALDMSDIPSNSVDYVFTDPPYGGAVQYFELSTLWCAWLNQKGSFGLDYNDEITINDSQKKNFEFYHNMLRKAFEEVYRVLKTGKWLTVTFHNTDIRIYNSIIKAVVLSGFDLEKIIYQPPARTSAKGLLQPYGSAVGDYYIRFRKPEKQSLTRNVSEIDKVRYERIVVDALKRIIGERGEPTSYSTIVNAYQTIYDQLKKSGYLFSAPEGIEEILKKNLNKEFTLIDATEKGKRIGKLWWLKGVNFLDRVPLSERVEKAIINVLNRKYIASFDEVLEEIFIAFPNSLTPDTQSIGKILENYAEKTKDGKWRLRPNIRIREQEHDQMVESLAIIGERAGFDVHADISGWRKDIFPDIPKENMKDVKEIDVIWFTKTEITHEFEVENTTGGQSAIIRGSNISNKKIKRFIVIPEERQETIYNKINIPALKERVETENWRFIFYDELKNFFNSVKRKQKINLEDFEKIFKTPQAPKKIVETSLDFFNPQT